MTFFGLLAVGVEAQTTTTAPIVRAKTIDSLSVPADFAIELVAGPPLIERPMMAGFDDRGRLFVAESAGLNLDFNKLRDNPPNFIRMLEDTDDDGLFDKSSIFADRMTFPSGALWHDGALYVVSPPSLWKLEDKDDDGVCDTRTEIVRGFGSIGNAADLHGPFLGPDGWLYFCDGRNGHDLTLHDGTAWKGLAACVYRCRTDGSGLEIVFGGGMDNPVEAVFTPEGEMLVSCNLVMAHPRRIDGILFGIEGGVYPYHPCSSEFKQTGDLLKPVGNLGWVAVSGLMRYQGDRLGRDFDSNLFSTLFNPHRVQRHLVQRDGAGFRIDATDFLTSTDPDFHPTDILQDADGSILVLDTGGWFRIGCPESQIEKPQVLGGIYRVRRTDAPRVPDPRGLKLNWHDVSAAELVTRLTDPRPVVVERASARLANTADGEDELAKMALGQSGQPAMRAIWALARRETSAARSVVRRALSHPDGAARRTAIKATGLARDRDALPDLLRSLPASDLAESRESAIALGRIGDRSATPELLAELNRPPDPFHQHAVVYALIQIADREGVEAALGDKNPSVRRGALIALDQMKDGGLTPRIVMPMLDPAEPALHKAAARVLEHHPQWAVAAIEYLSKELSAAGELPAARREALRQQLLVFSNDPAVQTLIAGTLRAQETSQACKLLLLEVISQSPANPLPQSWVEALKQSLADRDDRIVRQAALTVRSLPESARPALKAVDLDQALVGVARDPIRSTEARVDALCSAAPDLEAIDDPLFDLLLSSLNQSNPALLRAAAADTVARAKLGSDQLRRLSVALSSAGPLELPSLLTAFARSADPDVGRALIAALQRAPGAKSLRPVMVQEALSHYPSDVRNSATPLLESLSATLAQQKARLDELERHLGAGDAGRGHALFFGTKAVCSTCHTIAGEGGAVGPDLSKIGAARGQRDLLEAIVFPSATFSRAYEPYVLRTRDGTVEGGVITRETADAIYLTTGPRSEKRFDRATISDLHRSDVSIMPQGLDAQLTPRDLADLIAFLSSLK